MVATVLRDRASTRLHPLPNPTEGERLAVLAVGGYGRGEMAPFSDVDLLFLTPWKITPWAESVIESMLYMLWDLQLKVGHASRTVKDCLRLGARGLSPSAPRCWSTATSPATRALADELRERLWTRPVPGHRRRTSSRPSSPSAPSGTASRAASATWSSPT